MTMDDIVFESMIKPDVDELLAFYDKQGHETTHSREKLEQMLDNTFCFVTARKNGDLIGLARGATDGLWGRIAECKLDPAFQGPGCVTKTDGRIEHDSAGIAREMAVRTIHALREFGVEQIDIAAYGTEVDFCSELGFKQMPGVVLMRLAKGSKVDSASVASAQNST